MMKDGKACSMHPKAPLVGGVAILIVTLLGMYSIPALLWLDVVIGAALVYAGLTGTCCISMMMNKCCKGGSCGTDTTGPL